MDSIIRRRALLLPVAAAAALSARSARADTLFTSFGFPVNSANGATATRTMPQRLWDVFNVKDFGALGNYDPTRGILTDDTAAIQAALNVAANAWGGTVYFPRGT